MISFNGRYVGKADFMNNLKSSLNTPGVENFHMALIVKRKVGKMERDLNPAKQIDPAWQCPGECNQVMK